MKEIDDLYEKRDFLLQKLGKKCYEICMTEEEVPRAYAPLVKELEEIFEELSRKGYDADYEKNPLIEQCPRCGMMILASCTECLNCGWNMHLRFW